MLHHRQGTSPRLSSGRKEVYPTVDKKESLSAQKAEAKKKARQYENQVKILLNKQRNAERNARTSRLCKHGAILEGVFPATVNTDGEAIKEFLIEVSLLPGVRELTEKMLNAGDEG